MEIGADEPRVARQVALGEQVSSALRADILTGAIRAGDSLVEAPLAATFGVSRGPVRDALRTLAAEGLIVSAGRSYRVTGLDATDVSDLYALRGLLETYACQQAATGDPGAYRAAAEAALADMHAASTRQDAGAFAQADIAFHSAFYRAGGNRRVSAIWKQHAPTFEILFRLADTLDQNLDVSVARHRTLLDTVLGGDPTAIATAVERHLSDAEHRIAGALRQTVTAE